MLHISMIMGPAAKMGIWPCLAFLKIQQLVSVRFSVPVTYLALKYFFFYTLGSDNENYLMSIGAPVNYCNTFWTVTYAKTMAVTQLTSLCGIHTELEDFLLLLLLLGTHVYILNGTDPEGDPVRYGLMFERGSKEYFRVDSKSGNVTLIQELDREVNIYRFFLTDILLTTS